MSKKGKSGSKRTYKVRQQRYFSDTFKRQKIKELHAGLITVKQISTLYEVSVQSIYRWLYKYSPGLEKGVKQVVQMESESEKTKQLLERLSELERIVGQKQLQIDYLEKLVEISSSELKLDLKKSFGTKCSSTSTASLKRKDLK